MSYGSELIPVKFDNQSQSLKASHCIFTTLFNSGGIQVINIRVIRDVFDTKRQECLGIFQAFNFSKRNILVAG